VLANDYVAASGLSSAAVHVNTSTGSGHSQYNLSFADGTSYNVFAVQNSWSGTLGTEFTWTASNLDILSFQDGSSSATITWGGICAGGINQFNLYKNGTLVATASNVTYQTVTDKVPTSPTYKLETQSMDVTLVGSGPAGIEAGIHANSQLHISFNRVDGLYDPGDPTPTITGTGNLQLTAPAAGSLAISSWQTSAATHGTVVWNSNHTQLVYTPDLNFLIDASSGIAAPWFTYTITDGGVVLGHSAKVTIGGLVNHAPTIDTVFNSNYPVLEDASTQALSFHVDDQETPAFNLNVTASAYPAGLVDVSVTIPPGGAGGDRQLQITPVANQFGTATVTIIATDASGTATTKTIQLTVQSVNDAPSFTPGGDVTVKLNTLQKNVANWATNLFAGADNESSQQLNFLVTGGVEVDPAHPNPSTLRPFSDLFSEPPTVSSSGTLSFKPKSNAFGTATVTVQLHDDGGTDFGGVDTSNPITFKIIVDGNTLTLSNDTVDEMQQFTVSGTATGTPGAVGAIVVNWGDRATNSVMYSGNFDSNGLMSFTFPGKYRDDQPGQTPDMYTINCRVTQSPELISATPPVTIYTYPAVTINVNNVAPTQDLKLYYWDGTNTKGHNVLVSGAITDPSPDDQFTMHVDWGDGKVADAPLDRELVDLPGTQRFYSHVYLPGAYQVTVEDNEYGYVDVTARTTDDDGGQTPNQTFHVLIDTAPNNNLSGQARNYNAIAGSLSTFAASAGLLNGWEDLDHDVLTPTVTAQPVHGTVTVNSDGSFTYNPGSDPFTGEDTFTYKVSDGWIYGTATVNINTYNIHLQSVDFAGDGNIPIISDPDSQTGASKDYSSQEWLENNNDVSQAHQYPVGYVSGSNIAVSPEFDFIAGSGQSSTSVPAGFMVRATGPDGNAINPSKLNNPTDAIYLFKNKLTANVVKYYEQFQIQWQVSADGGNHWADVGASSNPLYSTYANRATNSPVYESVIALSTKNADTQTTRTSIATSIYGEFQDQQVTIKNNTVLKYWGPYTQANATDQNTNKVESLLQHSDGNCAAFANLFEEMLQIQGLGDSVRVVQVLAASNPTSVASQDFKLLLGSWQFGINGTYPDASDGFAYRYPTAEGETDLASPGLIATSGPRGQGNVAAPAGFVNHFIVHWLDTEDDITTSLYFDPSYGTTASESLMEWQSKALAGTTKTKGGVIVAKIIGSPIDGEATLDVKTLNDF
jgi:hypothetical protein